jgi:hypothetical protein
MTQSRFKDSGESVYDFLFKSDVLVECPHCLKCAKGIKIQDANYEYSLICKNCGILTIPKSSSWSNSTFMGLNLWLRTSCCGNVLWGYNKDHLDFLDDYINSSLRERIPNKNQSLASRLPEWIKTAKNRQELTKGIQRLRERLIKSN